MTPYPQIGISVSDTLKLRRQYFSYCFFHNQFVSLMFCAANNWLITANTAGKHAHNDIATSCNTSFHRKKISHGLLIHSENCVASKYRCSLQIQFNNDVQDIHNKCLHHANICGTRHVGIYLFGTRLVQQELFPYVVNVGVHVMLS